MGPPDGHGADHWGDPGDHDGQLGVGDNAIRSTPTQVTLLEDVRAISVGAYSHSCATTSSGALYCWGGNWRGELGVGDTEHRSTPPPVFPV